MNFLFSIYVWIMYEEVKFTVYINVLDVDCLYYRYVIDILLYIYYDCNRCKMDY